MSFADPRLLLPALPAMLLALTVHEWAHAYSAWRLGDPTARALGRMTLNPLAHLDLFGTLAMVLIGFGWAKPVPVDPRNLAHPRRDMMWIAAAGPLSNLLQACVFGVAIQLFHAQAGGLFGDFFTHMISYAVFINCALAIFNLLPIAPLDGSKIIYGLLPGISPTTLFHWERYGPLVLMGLVMLGFLTGYSLIWMVMSRPVMALVSFFSGGML